MHVVVVGSVELIEPRCSSAVLERRMSYTKILLPARRECGWGGFVSFTVIRHSNQLQIKCRNEARVSL